jgi:hypothetical protein
MTTSFLDCSQSNPFRPPNWRWLRTMGIINGSQPEAGRRRDGTDGYKWINAAKRYQMASSRAMDDLQRARLASDYPELFWAHTMYLEDHNPTKWEVEARILARCDDWEIGFHCGLPEGVVKAYESVFFNVREKLVHRGYVVHSVMGRSVQLGLAEREFDLLWKMYAYAYGPNMLQILTSKFCNPSWCGTLDEVGSAVQDDTVATMKMKASLAAKTLPVNMSTQLEILHIFTKYVEIERMSDSEGKAQNQILDHISTMFNVMPLNVAGLNPRNNEAALRSPVHAFETTAVELSYEEIMEVAVGKQLPHSDMLKQLHFPPSPAELETIEAGGSTQ